MEDEEGYTTLNLRFKKDNSSGLSPTGNKGAHQRPHWLLVALGVGNIILEVAVLAVCVSQLASEMGQSPAASGSDRAGSRDTSTPPGSRDTCTAISNTRLEYFRANLTQSLCPGPAGSSGCQLCPTDWQLHGDKCYWVSRDSKTWDESRTNCSARGTRLLVIQDREELQSLKDLTQGTNQFWIGLSHSPEKGWTWLDGSWLDQTLFPVSGQAKENSCGLLKRNQIHSVSCGSSSQWICQRDAVTL